MTLIELKRVFEEWRLRLQRVQQVLNPPEWSEHDWKHFSKALYLLIKKYGSSWTNDGIHFWDLRWNLREGGELICQIEEKEDVRSLVVAQSGGFVEGVEHYTWFYGEFNNDWNFSDSPYWVDGSWKDALAMILLPQQMAAGFYLSNSSVPMQNLLLSDSSGEKSVNESKTSTTAHAS